MNILRLEAITSALASGIIKDKTVTGGQKGYKNHPFFISEG